MATVVTPQAANQSAKAERSTEQVWKTRTDSDPGLRHTGVNFGGTDISAGRIQVEVSRFSSLLMLGVRLFRGFFKADLSSGLG